MKYNPLTRRMFLQGSGGTMLAIPLLTSLLPRELWAAPPGTIKRFVSILGASDVGHNSGWLPNTSGSVTNLVQPNRIFNPGNGQKLVRWQPLREFAPTNSSVLAPIYGSSFSPYLESMCIMRSLDSTDFRGHDCSKILGAFSTLEGLLVANMRRIPTIDHVINSNRTFNPKGSPVIYAGHTGGQGNWSHSFVAPNSSTHATHLGTSLMELYNRLFSNGSYPEGGQNTPAHPRRDILTRILGDYSQVRNSRNISIADRTALDNALDKISDVQRGLAAAVSSGICSHRNLSRQGIIHLGATFPEVGRAVADMITASIMCDTARTFTIGAVVANPGGYDDYVPPNGAERGVMDGVLFEHDISTHMPFRVQDGMTMWQRGIRRQAPMMQNIIAPLIRNLATATDPSNGQSYLYNSLVFSSFESGQSHGYMSQPAILFGNAGGDFGGMGNYIDYSDRANPNPAFSGCDFFSNSPSSPEFSNNYHGLHYNRLLVNILQAMGIPASEYESYADNSQLFNRSDLGTVNANLTSVGGYGYPIVYDLRRNFTPEEGLYNITETKKMIANYDIRQFRNKLPMPT